MIPGSLVSNALYPRFFPSLLGKRSKYVIRFPYVSSKSFPLSSNTQVAYILKSAARPETIPTCLTTIALIKSTNQGFIYAVEMMFYHARSIGDQFHKIRQLYEIHEIQNKVPDGTISFPEDSRSLASGITVEFRHVASSL